MGPLLALLAGGKGKPMDKSDDMSMGEPDAAEAPEDSFAGDAFDALQDKDRQGFVDAFKSAVRACSKSYDAAEPDADDEG
jgi:hypothetical protein